MTSYQELLLKSVDEIVDNVKITLGTFGRTVLYNNQDNKPHITKDGVSVARHILPNDGYKALITTVLKEAAEKTLRNAGDGTTTTLILAQAIIRAGVKELNQGMSFYEMAKQFDNAVKDIKEYITREISIPIEGQESILKEVASISANNDTLGSMIYDIIEDIGIHGHIDVRESQYSENKVDKFTGMKCGRGWMEGFMINDHKSKSYKALNPIVVVFEDMVRSLTDLIKYFKYAGVARPIVFFVDDVSDIVLKELKQIRELHSYDFCIIQHDGYGDRKYQLMDDLCAITGAWAVKATDELEEENIGGASEIIAGELYTTIVTNEDYYNKDLVETIISEIKADIAKDIEDDEVLLSGVDRKWLRKRLANLTGGMATIHAGGRTEMEMREVKDRLDDAVLAVSAAVKEGVCYGGGYAFIKAKESLDKNNHSCYNIVLTAIEEPFRQLLINADRINQYHNIKNQIITEDLKYDLRTASVYETTSVYDPVAVLFNALDNSVAVAKSLLSVQKIAYDGQVLAN